MDRFHPKSGTLEMIVGCMFSGKSSELIQRIRLHRIIGHEVMVVNHVSNKRYAEDAGGAVSSHDHDHLSAVGAERLYDIVPTEAYAKAQVIFVEEAQFFDDLYGFVRESVGSHGKHLVVSGLDGDYNREPYRQVVDLIPFADVVIKKTALCVRCKDGTVASFSKRTVANDDRNLVGGSDAYIPVCRFHYDE